MRASLAVRLDIRPRLRLAPDWQPGPAARRRFRLPPLALPAVGYWAAMAGLTYAFTQLGPHPLDEVYQAAAKDSIAAPAPSSAPPPVDPPPSSPPSAEAAHPPTGPAAAEPSEPHGAPEATEARVAPPPRREAPLPSPASLPPEPPSATLSFPEFTDSAPSRSRERASDGPRLDSLFERADTSRHAEPKLGPTDAPPERGPTTSQSALPSCEAAIAKNDERLEIGGPRGPADITREAYASILQNGSYLGACSVPERTVLEICAAVKHGRAVGVTVVSAPSSPPLNACVRRAVSGLSFPASERLDVTHTRFDAARR